MRFFAALSFLLFTHLASVASDEVTCVIEELACEESVSYEDIISFLHRTSLSPDSIKMPGLYVTTFAWLKTPYRYSGNTKNGIDCSRFAFMLRQPQIAINGVPSSADLFKFGQPVPKHDLKEGDLVFFRIKGGRISHVGVYLHNGKFAHSSTSQGVIVSDLSEPYWNRTFYMGARYDHSAEYGQN